MDIQLPILDGYESTRRIKSDPALRSIPIIAVTSYALSGGEDKDREAGCDAMSRRVLVFKASEILKHRISVATGSADQVQLPRLSDMMKHR
jgi:two-component system cell cycle response regulator DivK